jgi:hypothetical protein
MGAGAVAKLEQDVIVEALVADPAVGPPRATVLKGFLGKSSLPGAWRLYLTAALDHYVDIPLSEILFTKKLPEDRGTMVWVPQALKLRYTRTQSAEVEAGFLTGPIVAHHLVSAATPASMDGGTENLFRAYSPLDSNICTHLNTPQYCTSHEVLQ